MSNLLQFDAALLGLPKGAALCHPAEVLDPVVGAEGGLDFPVLHPRLKALGVDHLARADGLAVQLALVPEGDADHPSPHLSRTFSEMRAWRAMFSSAESTRACSAWA